MSGKERYRMRSGFNRTAEEAVMDNEDVTSSGDDLGLDTSLSEQRERSDTKDKCQLIVQHQTNELWMIPIVHKLLAARTALKAEKTSARFKMLAKVSCVFEQLNGRRDMLHTITPPTMTPIACTRFRKVLAQASRFQFHSHRMVGSMRVNRNTGMLTLHRQNPAVLAMLSDEFERQSLDDEVIAVLFQRKDGNNNDLPGPQLDRPQIGAFWKTAYQDTDAHGRLYELGEKMADLGDDVRHWGVNHMTTIERLITFKYCTGGRSGIDDPYHMLSVELFPGRRHLRGAL